MLVDEQASHGQCILQVEGTYSRILLVRSLHFQGRLDSRTHQSYRRALVVRFQLKKARKTKYGFHSFKGFGVGAVEWLSSSKMLK